MRYFGRRFVNKAQFDAVDCVAFVTGGYGGGHGKVSGYGQTLAGCKSRTDSAVGQSDFSYVLRLTHTGIDCDQLLSRMSPAYKVQRRSKVERGYRRGERSVNEKRRVECGNEKLSDYGPQRVAYNAVGAYAKRYGYEGIVFKKIGNAFCCKRFFFHADDYGQ